MIKKKVKIDGIMKCYVFLNVELNNGANRTIEINQMNGRWKREKFQIIKPYQINIF